MKKLFILLATIIGALVVAAMVAPFIISSETIKPRLIEAVNHATGKTLTIGGNVRFSFFPTVGVTAENVSLVGTYGDQPSTLLDVKKLNVQINALEYIRTKALSVESFTLVEPKIEYLADDDGRTNWRFYSSENKTADVAADKKPENSPSELSLSLNDFVLEDAAINYKNTSTGSTWTINKLNAQSKMKSMGAPLTTKGSANVNGEDLDFSLNMDSLDSFIKDNTASIDAKIESNLLSLAAKGGVSLPATFNGSLTMQSSSLVKLQSWVSKEKVNAPTALKFQLSGNAQVSSAYLMLSEAQIALDDLQLTGNASFKAAQGVTPTVFDIDLLTDKLDLSPYVPASKSAAALELIASAHAASPAGWSNEKIDLSSLKNFEGSARLRFNSLHCNQFTMGKSSIDAGLKFGELDVAINRGEVFGGIANVSGTINANDSSIVLRGDLQKIKAAELLKATADYGDLSGTLDSNFLFNMQGSSEQEFASSLAGNGNFLVRDGALKGYDIASMVRDVKGILKPAKNESKKTDFAELSGSFTAKNGVISNPDLSMMAPLLRLKGQGNISMANRTLYYRLQPTLVDTAKGQDGGERNGITIPLLYIGAWDDAELQLDAKGAMENIAKDPEKLKENFKNLKGLLKKL